MISLEIQHLVVAYGKAEVLHGVDLAIFENEIVSIIGPNGSGKTTMLKAISGLIPYNGSINFLGESLNSKSNRDIVKAGLIHCPEGRHLFNEMTVMENLEMGTYLRRDETEIQRNLNWIYTLFPILHDRSSQIAGTLSGGEQQMVAIARSLMSKPILLMLDEPSFGLAPLVKTEVLSAINKIAESDSVTILLVEQDVRLAVRVAQKFFVLEFGSISFEGDKRELLQNRSLVEVYLGVS